MRPWVRLPPLRPNDKTVEMPVFPRLSAVFSVIEIAFQDDKKEHKTAYKNIILIANLIATFERKKTEAKSPGLFFYFTMHS